jgi:3-phenylpropionate/cinnamic acid dioxygenase small subunit
MSATLERTAAGPVATVAEVEQFLYREAALLDGARYDDWLALFAPDCLYWVPLEAGQPDGIETCSIIHDDFRLLEVRVKQYRHPRAHARTPHARTVHQVGNVVLGEQDAARGELTVHSNLVMIEFRAERQRTWGALVEHRLRRTERGLAIVRKRVDLANSEAELDGIAVLF